MNLDFLVVDTEGKDYLSEIAILDCEGNLVYEAFTLGHPKNQNLRVVLKPLAEIVREVGAIAQNKTVICHYAEHDQKVLKKSFAKAIVPWQPMIFECTCELTRQNFPDLKGYDLGYLSRQLQLKVDGRLFDRNYAHATRYDALFTHQLYLKLVKIPMSNSRHAEVRSPYAKLASSSRL
jgi:DNA polymerase III epsilon subunit-like protein